MNLAAWLISMVGPIVARAIISAGFSIVSFAAVTTSVNSLVTLAQNNWAALPANVLAFAALFGVPQFLGMVFAAYTARVGVWVAANGAKYILKH